jgi:hypothetical protein
MTVIKAFESAGKGLDFQIGDTSLGGNGVQETLVSDQSIGGGYYIAETKVTGEPKADTAYYLYYVNYDNQRVYEGIEYNLNGKTTISISGASVTALDIVRYGIDAFLFGNDQVTGNSFNDVIFGLSGSDTLDGGGGNDELNGGSGNDFLFGRDGNDRFLGEGGNDALYGGAGDDVFYGGNGSDLIDGDVGNDMAGYFGNQSNYTLTLGPSSTIMTDRTGTEGTDTLINIEKLTFADRTLDLDNYSSLTQLNDTQFSDLAKVYVAYFNRAADAEGLYFWADKLAEGMDMTTIASHFSQSAEAKALYPDTANTSAFVTAVYANVLGRTPDQAGFDFWTTNLNNGAMQPATFVLSIIDGAQGADITYLSNKADLGVYFSTIKGMSNVADAQNVLNIFGDQSTSNTAGAKASVDGHFTDATASGSGEFIFELVGIVNDPFAGVI